MSVNTSSNSGGAGRDGARTGSSLLAPSKFSSNFLSGSNTGTVGSNSSSTGNMSSKPSSDSGKTSFAGFKASKLSSVTQSLFGSDSKKEATASTISWASPATATAANVATATPVPTAEAKEEVVVEKSKPIFLPLEPKPLIKESKLENGENSSGKKSSPAKRAQEADVAGEQDEEVISPKRVRFEVAPPVVTSPPAKIETEEASSGAKETNDGVVSAGESKIQKSETNLSPRSTSESPSFVFGENLIERADNFASVKSANFVFGQNLIARAENFSPEQKEAEAAKAALAANTTPVVSSPDPKSPPKSLSESAAAYYESHAAPKRKYDEVVVVTGEEGEVNVVQMSAKLHWFDKASGNWTERGRGLLRLNDIAEVNAKTSAPPSSSRLVMRTAGSLRVILNTKLYRGMPVDCPSEKTLRLTGMDDSGVLRVFLVTGTTKDISNMHAALQFRLAAIEKAQAKDGQTALTDEESDDDDCSASKIKAPRLV